MTGSCGSLCRAACVCVCARWGGAGKLICFNTERPDMSNKCMAVGVSGQPAQGRCGKASLLGTSLLPPPHTPSPPLALSPGHFIIPPPSHTHKDPTILCSWDFRGLQRSSWKVLSRLWYTHPHCWTHTHMLESYFEGPFFPFGELLPAPFFWVCSVLQPQATWKLVPVPPESSFLYHRDGTKKRPKKVVREIALWWYGKYFIFSLCCPIFGTNCVIVPLEQLTIENPCGHIGGMGTKSLTFEGYISNITCVVFVCFCFTSFCLF